MFSLLSGDSCLFQRPVRMTDCNRKIERKPLAIVADMDEVLLNLSYAIRDNHLYACGQHGKTLSKLTDELGRVLEGSAATGLPNGALELRNRTE